MPRLAAADPRLTGVLDKLDSEHAAIHRAVEIIEHRSDSAQTTASLPELRALAEVVESHFSYEERELWSIMNQLRP